MGASWIRQGSVGIRQQSLANVTCTNKYLETEQITLSLNSRHRLANADLSALTPLESVT